MDKEWYASHHQFWSKSNTELDLSELYTMTNIQGFNDRCTGGNVAPAMNYAQKYNVSVDLESNWNYEQLWKQYQHTGKTENKLPARD